MKNRRFLSFLLAAAVLVTSYAFAANAVTTDVQPTGYTTATQYDSKNYQGSDLGAVYTKASTTFKVWAPSAESVTLKLYKTGSDAEPGAGVISETTMTDTNGTWRATVTGDLNGVYYTYLVNVGGTVKETQDVYSKATGVNGQRSMVIDLDTTDPQGWDKDAHVLFNDVNDAMVWEVHVRDFSIDKSSGVSDSYKGKYLAFTEGGTTVGGEGAISTGIDYLVEQGINAVQIMPAYDFKSVDETKKDQRNWGYDPLNYNVPEGSYSTNPYSGDVRIKEFKQMIQALHDRGIAVIMDVVYNHVSDAPNSCFEKTVPGYYFRMKSETSYHNSTGCGNVTASDREMFRKYMVDSVKYWVEEYHIDGFRFDLMGCHDITTMNTIRSEVNSLYPDNSGKKIIMYGEPWMANQGDNGVHSDNSAIMSNAKKLSAGIGMFNDKFRDAIKGDTDGTSKGYIQGTNNNDNVLIRCGIGANSTTTWGNNWADNPARVVTYSSAHDNLCLWDKIVKSNGSTAWNTPDALYLAQDKLSAALVLTSQGTPFIMAGDDMGRTKQGDHNSYKSNDDINKIDWTRLKDAKFAELAAYYKGLRQIRSVYSPFSDPTTASIGSTYFVTPAAGVIGYTILNETANKANEWGMTAVIYNNTASSQQITLQSKDPLPATWTILANSSKAGLTSLGEITGSTFSVPARTAYVLTGKSKYTSLNLQGAQFTTLTTKHVDSKSGEILKTTTSKLKAGSKYRATSDADLLWDYTVDTSYPQETGTVTESPVTVTVKYNHTGVGSGYINVKYLELGTEKELKTPIKERYHEGDKYAYGPAVIGDYELAASVYPAGSMGTFTGSGDRDIVFYYTPLSNESTVVHFYNSKGWTEAYCYAQTTTSGGKPLGNWPGTKMSPDPETGTNWFKITVPINSTKVLFSKNSNGDDQIPASGQQGFPAIGEAWINESTVTFDANRLISFIDVETGLKIIPDQRIVQEQVNVSESYGTAQDELDGYGVPIKSYNNSGKYYQGVMNTVLLYQYVGSEIEETTQPITESAPQPSTVLKEYNVLLGDADNNGAVNLKDATLIQKYLAKLVKLVGEDYLAADVNLDWAVTLKDATSIQKYLARIPTGLRIGEIVTKYV